MTTFHLYWSPEGRRIATVVAKDAASAIRKAPASYSKYRGEIYATPATPTHMTHAATQRLSVPCGPHHSRFGGGCLNCGYEPQ